MVAGCLAARGHEKSIVVRNVFDSMRKKMSKTQRAGGSGGILDGKTIDEIRLFIWFARDEVDRTLRLYSAACDSGRISCNGRRAAGEGTGSYPGQPLFPDDQGTTRIGQ